MGKTPEGMVLASLLEYLFVKGIFHMRMNSGSVRDKTGRPVRMHEPGTADILAFIPAALINVKGVMRTLYCPMWIECKAPKGKQSELQKEFQERVEREHHRYILAYSIDDLIKAGL